MFKLIKTYYKVYELKGGVYRPSGGRALPHEYWKKTEADEVASDKIRRGVPAFVAMVQEQYDDEACLLVKHHFLPEIVSRETIVVAATQ